MAAPEGVFLAPAPPVDRRSHLTRVSTKTPPIIDRIQPGWAICHPMKPADVVNSVTKIDQIETMILDVPTIRGHVLSMATMRTQTAVLVKIRFADGSEGIGEGTTIGGLSYGAESPESIQSAIATYISPALLGRDGNDVNGAIQLIGRLVKGNRIAKAAVEIALWDGLGKRLGVPVSQLFGGAVHEKLPVAWTLASGNSDTDIAEAEEMIETRRHNIFKLKIGKRSVREDVAHVARIKKAVGDAASVRVDVNTAWSLQDARWGLKGLQDAGCELVEQPVQARYRKAMAELARGYEIAVMADEALNGPEDALAVVAGRAADVFAVKVAQSGGLKRASEVIAIGEAAGLGLYGGTMLETGLGTAAALQLFATVERLHWGTEFFGPLLLTDEILAEPIVYRDFCVETPKGNGIGATLDPDKIAFFRRDGGRTVKAVVGE
ncbi:muconate/chloromuconate family cycloisomerase [Albidovulum salinarum]|uniref:muconate/chloromuconate family cycloisomerase n=1 Tax=Albidovulum salinarum TaxID=2984153 RepID=UPI002958D5E1|nr:muconate/chloromuconate family cycloisomerase [Defluviimonas sp. WL0024]